MKCRCEGVWGNRQVSPKRMRALERADMRGAGESAQREGGPRGKQGFPRATEPKAREAP